MIFGRYRVRLFPIVLLILLGFEGYAQGKKYLTLEDAIVISLEKSYQMKSLRLSLVKAEQNLLAAKGAYRTNASLGLYLPSWNESVSEIMGQNSLPVFNTTGSFLYQGILNISQPLPTNGTFSLQSQAYHRSVSYFDMELDHNQDRKDLYTSLSLHFNQPLFTVNTLKLGLRKANLNFEITKLQYDKSQYDMIYSVTQAFFDLYKSTRNLQISKDNYEQQQELFDIAKKKFEADLIPEVEALQMEVDLIESKNDFVAAQGVLTRTEDSFKKLIGLKLSDGIGVLTDFEIKLIEIDLDNAIEIALEKQMEIRQAEINIELSEYSIKEVKSNGRIQGQLSASYDLTGVSNSSWEATFDDLRDRPHNRSVVLSLSVPLWDGGVNRANVISAETTLKEQQLSLDETKKDIILEVRNIVGRIQETENRLQVLEKNQELAQRSFDISSQRFNLGDITSQELALDRNRQIQAKVSYLDAYIDYKLALADLKRITMHDFENTGDSN